VNVVEESRRVLEQLIPGLREEGYTVYVEPSRQLLPSFMQGYIPDAIALRSDKNLAIEMIVDGPSAKSNEDRLKQRFDNRNDWELRVYYIRPAVRSEGLPAMPQETIDESIASVENLIASGEFSAAFLVGWATFEALGRALSPEKLARPQTPAYLIEVLATGGMITPSEADLLRELANWRNRLIHGTLDQNIDKTELRKFVSIIKTLRQLI
jgi:hypothetical protein